MRRWRVRLLVLFVLFAGLVGVLAVALSDGDPVTPETAHRIQVGMTRAEVEGLLGRPDGRGVNQKVKGGTKAAWAGPKGAIYVEYDADGRVAQKKFEEVKTTAIERAHYRAMDRLKDWGFD